MDWPPLLRLRGAMDEDDQHRHEVTGRLFALLTAKFEDGAELVVLGQNPTSIERARLASEIVDLGQQIVTIAEGLLLQFNSAGR
jgi:hypothetical protein